MLGVTPGLVGFVGSDGGKFGPIAWPDFSDVFDFVGRTYRKSGVTYPDLASVPGWSFSRALAGYAETVAGGLTLFGSDVPRITDKGFLAERASTNLLLRSQEFDNAGAWSKSAQGTGVAPTVVANAATAPDGTNTADVITFNCVGTASSDRSRINQLITYAVSGGVVQFSVWLRVASGTQVLEITTFATGTSPTTPALTVTVTTTWQRFVVQTTQGTGSPTTMTLEFRARGNISGGAAFDVQAWGAQNEEGATATSYIPTTTAAVTRPADIAAVTGASVATPHTLYAAYSLSSVSGAAQRLFQVDDGTANNVSALYNIGASERLFIVSGGAGQADFGIAQGVANTSYRLAGRVDTDNANCALNGTLGVADTSVTLPTGQNVFRLGSNETPGAFANGYLRTVGLIPRALSDAELQTLAA